VKPIILITSCSYRLKENDLCRETWLKEWGHLIDYKFVMGFGCPIKHGDELIVSVDDGYYGLPDKIQTSHKWAWIEGYTHILKTDSDVYIHIPRLLASGFEQFPYSGNLYYPDFVMGAAYWLDRRATEILAHAALPYPGSFGGDDVWVGRIMAENGIQAHDDKRYHIGENIPWDEVISLHVSGPPKLDMKEIHARFTS
jgi:hypothetical protein